MLSDGSGKTCLCLLDYDHCAEVLRFLLSDRRAWADPLIHLLAELTEGCDHLVLGVGSRRQCPKSEKASHTLFAGNGYCSVLYSNREMHEKLLESLNVIRAQQDKPLVKSITFSPLMLGDLQNKGWEVGESFRQVQAQCFDAAQGSCTDYYKRVLVWAHIQWLKHHYTFARAIFIDDREDILEKAACFFQQDPWLIPAGIQLYLAHYVFIKGEEDSPLPRESSAGTGYPAVVAGRGLLLPKSEIRRVAQAISELSHLSDKHLSRVVDYLALIIITPLQYKLAQWDIDAYNELMHREVLYLLLELRCGLAHDSSLPVDRFDSLNHLLEKLYELQDIDSERYAFYQKTIYHIVRNYTLAIATTDSSLGREVKPDEPPAGADAEKHYYALFACLLGNIDLAMVFTCVEREDASSLVAFRDKVISEHGREIVKELVEPEVKQALGKLPRLFEKLDTLKLHPDDPEGVEEIMEKVRGYLQETERFCHARRRLPRPPCILLQCLMNLAAQSLDPYLEGKGQAPYSPTALPLRDLLLQLNAEVASAGLPDSGGGEELTAALV